VIKGSEVGSFKNKIEGYQKSINLIETRIDQMDTYIHTRESVIKENKGLSELFDVLQYKYKTLSDTLDYVNDLWKMTKNYVDSALDLFNGIQAKSTDRSVQNLTVITSMGVGATLIGLFTQKTPTLTAFGVLYFFILVAIGFTANKLIKYIYTSRTYKIVDMEADKNIS